jgi:hypothetical protein
VAFDRRPAGLRYLVHIQNTRGGDWWRHQFLAGHRGQKRVLPLLEPQPILRRCCCTTCRCCATAAAEGEILLRKDSVEGLVSDTNIFFRGGLEFEFFQILGERARFADGALDVGVRGIHRLMMDKKMSASTVDRAGPDQNGFC